jgi:hypothetical protein
MVLTPHSASYAQATGEGGADGEAVESWGPSNDARRRPAAITMIGFVLYDETGQPYVTFGYGSHDEAKAAREYVMAALIGAETVRGRR